ncbi:hypothetical protein Tco_1113982 [Tanacetum coccineum]|uniref:Uncharacterized protein n=1 Tax=Tanacetum coccineum TaxID=301880 RepID=A0ABQ5IXF4_9ASTR
MSQRHKKALRGCPNDKKALRGCPSQKAAYNNGILPNNKTLSVIDQDWVQKNCDITGSNFDLHGITIYVTKRKALAPNLVLLNSLLKGCILSILDLDLDLAAHASPSPVPSPLLPSSGCPTQIQTLRIASTQALIDAVTAALPSPPLPPLPPSLYIPPPIDHRDDISRSSTARPTRGRGIDYGFVSMVDAEERRQGIRDVGYGIRDTWVDPAEAVPEIAPMTVGEVNTRVIELAELHEHDTQDLYALLEDAQDSRSRISQRVDMDSQRVDLLMGDRMTLQEIVWMVEEEAYASREA